MRSAAAARCCRSPPPVQQVCRWPRGSGTCTATASQTARWLWTSISSTTPRLLRSASLPLSLCSCRASEPEAEREGQSERVTQSVRERERERGAVHRDATRNTASVSYTTRLRIGSDCAAAAAAAADCAVRLYRSMDAYSNQVTNGRYGQLPPSLTPAGDKRMLSYFADQVWPSQHHPSHSLPPSEFRTRAEPSRSN